jgi:hypothetical protein
MCVTGYGAFLLKQCCGWLLRCRYKFIQIFCYVSKPLFSMKCAIVVYLEAVLRIRTRDPGSGAFLPPGSGIRIRDPGWSNGRIRDPG